MRTDNELGKKRGMKTKKMEEDEERVITHYSPPSLTVVTLSLFLIPFLSNHLLLELIPLPVCLLKKLLQVESKFQKAMLKFVLRCRLSRPGERTGSQ